MASSRRWETTDRYSNLIYLTQERWQHIIASTNHPEMAEYEQELQDTIRTGRRQQDSLNPRKYRYSKRFQVLAEDNTHIVAIVLFAFVEDDEGQPQANNYVVTAFQKEIG